MVPVTTKFKNQLLGEGVLTEAEIKGMEDKIRV
jgi:hypothetical protein